MINSNEERKEERSEDSKIGSAPLSTKNIEHSEPSNAEAFSLIIPNFC